MSATTFQALPVVPAEIPAETLVVDMVGLGRIMRKKPSTIMADRCRAPHRVPPACTPPDTRQPLWVVADVLEWLRRFRQPEAPPPARPVAPPPPRRRGRPTKAEQVARRLAEEAAAKARQGGAA